MNIEDSRTVAGVADATFCLNVTRRASCSLTIRKIRLLPKDFLALVGVSKLWTHFERCAAPFRASGPRYAGIRPSSTAVTSPT